MNDSDNPEPILQNGGLDRLMWYGVPFLIMLWLLPAIIDRLRHQLPAPAEQPTEQVVRAS
jgi:hypothetical protein